MKTKTLRPNQIITLNDYPVHCEEVLLEYYSKCKQGDEVPFVPVIRKDVVKKHLDGRLLEEFEKFEKQNPEAEYFMLDGSHRTSALSLAERRIPVIVYEIDEDITEARKLVETGKILQNDTLEYSLEENCKILDRHFRRKPYFMTVEQKTGKMLEERILPEVITSN